MQRPEIIRTALMAFARRLPSSVARDIRLENLSIIHPDWTLNYEPENCTYYLGYENTREPYTDLNSLITVVQSIGVPPDHFGAM